MRIYDFWKNKETDIIWWTREIGMIGQPIFSFDKKKLYYLFPDYPHKLTKEEKEIFDKENPFWKDFFADR